MKLFELLFGEKPKTGEIWFSKSSNPFSEPRITRIKILETKENYVLYRFLDIDGAVECSAHEDYITAMYQKEN